MSNIIGEAFVRIRPNMNGFKSETEHGVRSGFEDLAKIAGVAFGAHEAFQFGKEIITSAADVQRQIQTITTEFGKAGDQILQFSKKGATGLGISEKLAVSTGARFGVLFKQLGIAPTVASKMTVGFEKLAGSMSAIRNVDPTQIMQQLPLAITGNVRVLKQLGIATDASQLKIAAWKLGLTNSITQGLTPAQRAMAIYAIATSKLGEFQKQAGQHSDDLANQSARLRAEWSNAKDELGKGLLPVAAHLTKYLADNLPNAVDKTKSALHDIGAVVTAVTKPVGGLKNAIVALLAAMVVGKIVGFANVIRTNLIQNGIKAFGAAAYEARTKYVGAMAASELATLGLAATIKAALISTLIGGLIVAIGFVVAYVITHWSQVKRWFSDFAGWLKTALNVAWASIRESAKAVAYGMIEYFTIAIQGILKAASHLPFVGKYAKEALNAIQDLLDKFKPDFSNVTDAFANAGAHAGQAFVAAMVASINGEVQTFGGTLPSLSALLGKTVNDATSNAVLGKNTPGIINAEVIKTNAALDTLHTKLRDTIRVNDSGIAKVREQLGVLNQNLTDAVTQEATDIRNAVESAKANLGSIATALSDSISSVIDKPLQDAQNKINRLANLHSLSALRSSALLPGGKALSTDPKKAIAQLEELRAHATALSRGAIDAFLAQYRAAYLTVKQDQAQVVKDRTKQSLADLTDSFNRGQLTISEYKKRVLALLTRDHVSYNKAGKLLGTAFANGFRDQVKGLFEQAGLISSGPHVAGTTGSAIQLVKPLEAIRADQKQIQTIQRQIRDKHGALQTRIAKATEKQNTLLAQIHAVQLGPTSNDVKTKNRQKNLGPLTGTTG